MNDDDSLRLVQAAIAARNSLRAVILPGLNRLATCATHPETVELIAELKDASVSSVTCCARQ